jgi:uncharacterized membrane protein YdjX (TVP38/TMEM64 family)
VNNQRKISLRLHLIIILIFCGTYLFGQDFDYSLNRLIGILNSGDVKGLLMYYTGYGNLSYLIAGLLSMLQTILPFLSKGALVAANYKYFGFAGGFMLTLLGSVAGAIYMYSLLKALCGKFIKPNHTDQINKYGAYLVAFLRFIPIWQINMLAFTAGIFELRLYRYSLAVILVEIVKLLVLK